MLNDYNHPKNISWETYCELGAINKETGESIGHDRLTGSDAYDHFALPLYLKQILGFNALLDKKTVSLEEIPRKEKVLFLYPLFKKLGFSFNYFELGTTLFEFIDGIEFLQNYYQKTESISDKINYYGIEISKLLRDTAIKLHPNFKIEHVLSHQDVTKIDLFYDRMVSSYCYSDVTELAELINRSKYTFANFFISKTLTFDRVNNVGKVQTYFGLLPLLGHLKKEMYYLFGRDKNDCVEGFFLCCDPGELDEIKTIFQNDFLCNQFMEAKKVAFIPAEKLALKDLSLAKMHENEQIKADFKQRLEEYGKSFAI